MAGMTLPADLVLRHGSTGSRVKRLQEALNDQRPNYRHRDLRVDGIFGERTEAAVKRHQKWHGLKVDGIAGPNTLRALGFALAGDRPAPVPDPPDVPTPEPDRDLDGWSLDPLNEPSLFERRLTAVCRWGAVASVVAMFLWLAFG